MAFVTRLHNYLFNYALLTYRLAPSLETSRPIPINIEEYTII